MCECSLPPEILDLIVDFLHDDPDALKACCLASQSWVHRSRKHLFTHVEFLLPKSHFQLWEKMFPDPSRSPARYARSLFIRGLPVADGPDTGVGEWIRTFRNVVRLDVSTIAGGDPCLAPLRGLSLTLKTLHLSYSPTPPSDLFGLVCSFPLLENLALFSLGGSGGSGRAGGWDAPLTSPKFTGSLNLKIVDETQSTVCQLLELPGGLRFTKIVVSCFEENVSRFEEDSKSAMNLMSRCSETLESLRINYYVAPRSGLPPLDLSKLTKLRKVAFGCNGSTVQWVTMTLQTIESTNLQQIVIHMLSGFGGLVEKPVFREWQGLDRVLLGYWNSHSIRPEIRCVAGKELDDSRVLAPELLPELTSREVLDLVEK